MPISREQKEAVVKELKEKFESAQSAVLADYRGLNVAEATKLRRRLREGGCELKVVKNTLTGLAARQVGLAGLDPYLEGPVAIAFSQDPVAPAKILSEFIRENKKMVIKAGVLENTVLDARKVKDLAELPSREVLLARVLGGMQSPLSGAVSVLAGTLRNFVYALEAVRKQRAGA